MFSPEYKKRLLKHCSPTARRLFAAPESSSPSDRFIPCRYINILHFITFFKKHILLFVMLRKLINHTTRHKCVSFVK